MYKIIILFLVTVLTISCSTSNRIEKPIEASNGASIVGIWAMHPLRNGIANVVEFTNDGKINLHSFNCRENSNGPVESSTYTMTESGKNIRLEADGEIQNLKLISIAAKDLTLGQSVGEELIKFSYLKVNRVAPLCFLYRESSDEKSKRTAFNESEFLNAPVIPDNKNILRYVGKWANDEGVVQIEVKLNPDGQYMIFKDNDENWNYLYKQVRWSDANLMYQAFAYSNKPELYDHPYHKSNQAAILAPVNDFKKIKWSFFISGERFGYILKRKN